MSSVVLLLLLITQAVGSSASSVDRYVNELGPCQPALPARTPDGWSTVALAEPLRLSIPPGAARVPDPNAFCLHGCDAWSKGGLEIAVSFGIWGRTSFAPEQWQTACVSKRDDVRIVVMQRENSLVIWPVQTNRPPGQDPVVRLTWSNESERSEAVRIAGSIHR